LDCRIAELGRKGMNMVWRLLDAKNRVVAWDRPPSKTDDLTR
jgi:6-phosphogluconate dehydrogenase (decarboxylating)